LSDATPSIFALEILGEPDDAGKAPVIEKRIVRAAKFEEATLIANACVLDAEKRGARGYCLMDHKGLIVTRWFMKKEPR